MKNSKLLKITLFLAGLIAAGIGAAILIVPVDFHATTGIDLGGQVDLLNEVRASSGALLALGLLVMLGAFLPQLTFTSTIVAALLYISYGFARGLSMLIDGIPVESLVIVAVVEIVIGLMCLILLLKYRENRTI